MSCVPSDHEFDLFRELVGKHSGITLSDAKRSLVASRLNKRLRQLGLSSFLDYYQRVIRDERELIHLIDLMTTNKTDFFRDPDLFAALRRDYIPAIIRRAKARTNGSVRVWSAACSSGEEPYSIAISLAEAFEQLGPVSTRIVATDISSRVLDRARAGVYELDKVSMLSDEQLRKFFLKGTGCNEGMVQVKPVLKEMITFERLNLHSASYPFAEPFDLIFCRNVLIYFSAETQRELMARIHGWMRPGAVLLTGHSESLHAMTHLFQFLQPSIYIRADYQLRITNYELPITNDVIHNS